MTLPSQSHANLCNEKDWNKALTSQQILDHRYNLLASQYNSWLPNFKQAIFLHQEFSRPELDYLWRNNNNDFQTTLTMQLESAEKATRDIDSLLALLDNTPPYIQKQWDKWYAIGEDCKQEGLMSNFFATELYLKANKELNIEIINLRQYLVTMRHYYEFEVVTLTEVMQTAAEKP